MNTLTKRQSEILKLISQEYTNNEIASLLYLSPHTVQSHRKMILAKLKARNTAGLIRRGYEIGILKLVLTT